jgi:hypothetical protein
MLLSHRTLGHGSRTTPWSHQKSPHWRRRYCCTRHALFVLIAFLLLPLPCTMCSTPLMQQGPKAISWQAVTLLASLMYLHQDVALAQQPSRQSWSCIVFATRKLATLAIEAVLRSVASLGFLMTAPFMGYGGNASAASLPMKVGQQQCSACCHPASLKQQSAG